MLKNTEAIFVSYCFPTNSTIVPMAAFPTNFPIVPMAAV